MLSKGLCSESRKNGKKVYRAIEPKIALQNILNHFQNEFDELFDKKKKLIKVLEDSLIKIHSDNVTNSERIDYIELLNDRNQIKNRWIELQKGIKKELLAFNKAPYTISVKQSESHQKEIIKRKAISKGIYELAEISSDISIAEFIETVQTYVKLGEECRIIKELPMKMVIIDRKITMLALIDPVSMKKSITTMIVNHSSFAFAQKQVFESYWEKSVPFAEFINNPQILE